MTQADQSVQLATTSDALRAAWRAERTAGTAARKQGDRDAEWHHLERAHLLSQPIAWLHVRTHGAMFRAAIRRRNVRETVGQLLRLVVAAPGSLSGRYPVGNTGGSDVSAFAPMPIPDDLLTLLTAVGGTR